MVDLELVVIPRQNCHDNSSTSTEIHEGRRQIVGRLPSGEDPALVLFFYFGLVQYCFLRTPSTITAH